jgi:N6-L-threonylcarbamoyladenine synthase
MIGSGDFNFSFSGLKTAVLHEVRKLNTTHTESIYRKDTDNPDSSLGAQNDGLSEDQKAEIAYAFEEAVVDVLCTKTMLAVLKYKPKAIVLAGGVAANKRLREELQVRIDNYNNRHPERSEGSHSKQEDSSVSPQNDVFFLLPPFELCGDNAAMIGVAAYYHILKNDTKTWHEITPDPNARL